jgi:hypothetical protein
MPADPVRNRDPEKALERIGERMREGAMGDAWRRLGLLERDSLPEKLRPNHDILFFALAGAGFGNRERLRSVHAVARVALRPDLHYRALLAHGLWAEAARYRRAVVVADTNPDEEGAMLSDWHHAAGMKLLARGKLRSGMRLYHHRFGTPNGPVARLTEEIDYVPLGAEALKTIAIEGDMGETFIHLAHLKTLAPRGPLRFIATPRWRGLLSLLFNDATLLPRLDVSAPPPPLGTRTRANGSGDYLALSMARFGTLRPGQRLLAPWRMGPARLGIAWRGRNEAGQPAAMAELLDLLLSSAPVGCEIVPLQFGLTDQERARLAGDPRVRMAGVSFEADPLGFLDTVRGLAGVISVDAPALHAAGATGVPAVALLSQKPHWIWGREGMAETLYPMATTLRPQDFSAGQIAFWWRRARAQYDGRTEAAPMLRQGSFTSPLFVVGAPGAGIVPVSAALSAAGIWFGPSEDEKPGIVVGTERLARGITDTILRDLLGTDPRGLEGLPDLARLPLLPQLLRGYARALDDDGLPLVQPWGYADARLSLIWPLLAEAFPHARWLVVSRSEEARTRMILASPALAAVSDDPAFWRRVGAAYGERIDALRDTLGGRVQLLDLDAPPDARLACLRAVLRGFGLALPEQIDADAPEGEAPGLAPPMPSG